MDGLQPPVIEALVIYMTTPNYRMFSIEQLNDALDHIDKEQFPDRVKTIKHYLSNPGPRANINKKQPTPIGKKTKLVLGWFSMEIMFWLILGGLGALGYAIC